MTPINLRSYCVAACILFLLPAVSSAQRNNRNDEKKENERVRRAEVALSKAKAEANEQREDLRKASRSEERASDEVVKHRRTLRLAEEEAEREIGKSIGLPDKLDQAEALRMKLERASEPVLAELHQSSEWLAAKSAADESRLARDQLREDLDLEELDRETRLKELNDRIHVPAQLDAEAIGKDANCQKIQAELTLTVEQIAELRKKISPDKVSSNSKVVAAKKSLKEAERTLSESEKALASVRSNATKAQRALGNATSNLEQAKKADSRDSNRRNK